MPSGFGSDYGSNWAGRYYTDSYSLIYVGFTPSIAYRINRYWSLGGSLNLTYTYSESTARINNLDPGWSDGKLEYQADVIGATGTLSLLYQFVENILPQRFQVGFYHELSSGSFVTLDGLWIDFSEFGTGDISIENNAVVAQEGIYNDIWGVSLGMGFPQDDRTTWKAGLMYASQAVDDDKCTLSFRLDRIWAVGVGISKQLDDSKLDFNLNVYNLGDAPVDTGTGNPIRGRVVGESSSPFAIALDIAWHW